MKSNWVTFKSKESQENCAFTLLIHKFVLPSSCVCWYVVRRPVTTKRARTLMRRTTLKRQEMRPLKSLRLKNWMRKVARKAYVQPVFLSHN